MELREETEKKPRSRATQSHYLQQFPLLGRDEFNRNHRRRQCRSIEKTMHLATRLHNKHPQNEMDMRPFFLWLHSMEQTMEILGMCMDDICIIDVIA